jgi:light-regulated signal transduction histidine kinase (bacteriophytochrome)
MSSLKKSKEKKLANKLQDYNEEPFHQIGRINARGLLLGFNSNQELVYFSSNIHPKIESLLQNSDKIFLSHFFNDSIINSFKTFDKSTALSHVCATLVDWEDTPHQVRFSKSTFGEVVVELASLDEHEHQDLITELSSLDSFFKSMVDLNSEEDMASIAVSHFKELTSFDRVICYKFDEDGDGEVLAEEKSIGLDSFLGLRYPANEISKQAKELYKMNSITAISDVNDKGISIYGLNYNTPVDLSNAVFRTASPTYLEYLKNMGVSAIFSTRIMNEGELWGMIFCYHYNSPKSLSFNKRMLATFFTNGFSLCIQNIISKEFNKRRQIQKEICKNIRQNSSLKSIEAIILHEWTPLSKELKLIGFSICNKNTHVHHGVVLEEIDISKIIAKLEENNSSEQPVNTLFFNRKKEITNDGNSMVSGLAAISLNDPDGSTLILYRKEKHRIYTWASSPNLENKKASSKSLMPQKNFEARQELVKNQSIPWQKGDKKMIQGLFNALHANTLSHLSNESNTDQILAALEKKINDLNYANFLLREDKEQLKAKVDIMVKTVRDTDRFNSLKSVVMSNMSHEMRTPLNGIMGLATLINESNSENKETNQFAELIYQSGARMLHTFNRLIALDLTVANSSKSSFTAFSLKNFFKSNLKKIADDAQTEEKSLNWHIHNEDILILSNEMILSQILLNLVNNALKYSGAKAIVSVNVKILVKNYGRFLQFSVEDNGPGINPEELEKVFEPFYMSSNITGNQDSSSGLGLYIVKVYTEYLGGTVALNSHLGLGSNFEVSIPIN